MRKLDVLSKAGMAALTIGAIVVGVTTLAAGRAQASPPGLLCGPTRQWICVLPGCPDCYDELFIGTICEKRQHEKETGRVCSPE